MENYSINISYLKKELIFFNYNIFHYPKNKSRGERKESRKKKGANTFSNTNIIILYFIMLYIICNYNHEY